MLNVTPAASQYLNRMLVQSHAPTEAAVRIVPKKDGGGLATTIDKERAGDQHYECEGRTVLVLDTDIAKTLSDQTLDLEQDGQRLVLS